MKKKSNKKIKILIFGVNGLLGNTLLKYCLNHEKLICYGTSRKKINLKNKKLFYNIDANNFKKIKNLIAKIKPHYIINCIGVVKAKVQNNKLENLYEINSIFPKKLEMISSQFSFNLIQISTDCVFSGKDGNYKDINFPDPVDHYGRSKFLGECKENRSMTLRTSIIGHNDYDKTGLLEWFLSQKKNIIGYKKAYFNGFSTLELSKIIIKQIILNNNFLIGIFHISSKKISKYDLLQKIKKLYNVKIAIKESNYFKIDRTLNSHKFKNIIQYKNPNWDQMLKEMKIFNERFK